jgi:hypothetical protein
MKNYDKKRRFDNDKDKTDTDFINGLLRFGQPVPVLQLRGTPKVWICEGEHEIL